MRRERSRLLAPLVVALLALPAATAGGMMAESRHAAARGLAAPGLTSPGASARVQSVPAFSWKAVKRAAIYEFQLSADKEFGSIVDKGSFKTLNTFATIPGTLADGTYYWRVRAISSKGTAGRWSSTRKLVKAWTTTAALVAPGEGDTVVWPRKPLVMRWAAVPTAYKYLVQVATDPSLASPAPGFRDKAVTTAATQLAVPFALPRGRYYWAVTPLDAAEHRGARSAVASFDWQWPTGTAVRVADSAGSTDLDSAGRQEVLAPFFSWDPVDGAARYQVEVNAAADFAPGSKVCCSDLTTGTSLSPLKFLANNVYHWRVRALDLDDNAGEWNYGADFRKVFDDRVPSIDDLKLRDHTNLDLGVGGSTTSPLITWSPVTGASAYEVHIAPYDGAVLKDCMWETHRSFDTATAAWTPLAAGVQGDPGPDTWPSASVDSTKAIGAGQWCARVFARSDKASSGQEIVSLPTYLGGPGQPGFVYAPAPPPPGPLGYMENSSYLSMQSGAFTPEMPVFRWSPVPGAASYFVVVARDSAFTNVVDVALTQATVYAPRARSSVKTYTDENTHYYWQVLPAASGSGTTCHCSWDTGVNHEQSFDKRSTPPALLAPGSAETVTTQPTFRWSAATGARTYRLQVAQDPTFSDPINDVVTTSTAFTSSSTYPADTSLYWRVRANDERDVGLNWSETRIFRRALPVPVLSSGNPLGGPGLPLITWSGVTGATSYDMFVEQADGTTKSFSMRSTAFTPAGFYGTGVWRWRVRANFPRSGPGETDGPYSEVQAFTRRIDAPTGTRYLNKPRRVLLSWDPSSNEGTKGYKVQVSQNTSFTSNIESVTTSNTSLAPTLTKRGWDDGGRLYWRVATVDEGGTVGAWTSRTLTLPKALKLTTRGNLGRRRTGALTVVVSSRGRAVRGVRIKVSGAGVRPKAKRTSRRGMVKLVVRPKRRGTVKVTAVKSGFKTTSVSVKVR